jgi:hypothetical protein
MGLRTGFGAREKLEQLLGVPVDSQGRAVVDELGLSPSTRSASPANDIGNQQLQNAIQVEMQSFGRQEDPFQLDPAAEAVREKQILQGEAAKLDKQMGDTFKKLRDKLEELDRLKGGRDAGGGSSGKGN